MVACFKVLEVGQPGWLSGLALPSAQGVILETLDRVPCQALCVEPASPSACISASLSLSVSLINKTNKQTTKKNLYPLAVTAILIQPQPRPASSPKQQVICCLYGSAHSRNFT